MWLQYEFMQFVGRLQGKRNKGYPVFDVLTTVQLDQVDETAPPYDYKDVKPPLRPNCAAMDNA